jgi:hypothetical protein
VAACFPSGTGLTLAHLATCPPVYEHTFWSLCFFLHQTPTTFYFQYLHIQILTEVSTTTPPCFYLTTMKLPSIPSWTTCLLVAITAVKATQISSAHTSKPADLAGRNSLHAGFRSVGYYGNWVSRMNEMAVQLLLIFS